MGIHRNLLNLEKTTRVNAIDKERLILDRFFHEHKYL